MSAWSITVDRTELFKVGDVLGSYAPTEVEGEGVWVRSVNGFRVWSCRTSGVLWEVTGDPCTERLDPRCLAGRLVWNARAFAMFDPDVEVTIEIPDGEVATATSSVGRSVVDLPRESVVPQYPMYVTEAASARIGVGSFVDLLQRSYMTVPAADGAPSPTPYLFVRDGEILVHLDWSVRDGFRTTQAVRADTTGEGTRPLRLSPLLDLLQYIDTDGELTVVVPKDPSVPLLVAGDGFRFALDPVLDGAARHHDHLERVLRDSTNGGCRTLEQGQYSVDVGERTVHVELVDLPTETIVLTTCVCDGVEETAELLAQINHTNAGLSGARLWVTDGVVWARSELPVASIDGIDAALRALDRQLQGFEVLFGGFGVGA